MGADDTFLREQQQKFQLCNTKLGKLVYRDSEEFRIELKKVLDDFNSLEYSLKFVKEETAGEILARCCYLASCHDKKLVSAVSQLVVSLISRQQLVLTTQVHTVTEYITKCLRDCHIESKVDLLRALSAILYENTHNLTQFHKDLIGENGILVVESESKLDDIQRSNTQCLENICLRVPGCSYLSEEDQTRCYNVLLKLVHKSPPPGDDAIHCRRVVSCVRGLHNLVTATKTCPPEYIGPILAALKVYMLYGLPGQENTILPTLYPRTVPFADTPKTPATHKSDSAFGDDSTSMHSGNDNTTPRRGRKKTRGRGRGRSAGRGGGGGGEELARTGMQNLNLDSPGNENRQQSDPTIGAVAVNSNNQAAQSLLSPWRHGYSSESDLSDTEGGQSAKLRAYHSNVRQCSLGCLHAIVKSVEKRVMFGYWSALLPDGPTIGAPSQGSTLFTCITKDSSPKARSGALVVLSTLVEGSKAYLAHADDTEQAPSAFTPFSISLGYMVKELHRGLLYALAAENSPLVLTQIFKCLAVLVPNVPYQKLRPGLLNRIIKHVKPFLAHREPNIRVACLTCLGSVVSVQAPMMEVWQALQAAAPSVAPAPPMPTHDQSTSLALSDRRSRNSSESGINPPDSPRVSGPITPILSSGSMTPSLTDTTVGTAELPWVVRLCLSNVIPGLGLGDRSGDWSASRSIHTQPQPVKLESLQLLALLSKGYFMLVKDSLLTICELIQKCLEDSDPSIQLHGAKLLEELGSAILQHLRQALPADTLDIAQVEELWVRILSGPLPKVLQEPAHYAVRATACDCMANIGPQVFERLTRDKRVMCITLLLGFTSDPDYHVRASAVRALGVYVLYPCLRDDVSFVADVANVIINALQETNLSVKVKAAWSLGNLSDALVLNRDAEDESFIEDFADMLLLKLFEVATKASQDNDKVKANAVRGLGGLLRYLPPRSYNSVRFNVAVELSIKSLVKTITSGTMKIRWNACYATANMFHNGLLPLGQVGWTSEIHIALASVVKDCKNFKVRINAAMAFCVPNERRCYGTPELYKTIWVSLILGLVESEAVADFTEFKYRDSLCEQVCKTVLHLASLVEPVDLDELGPALEKQWVPFHPFIQRWYQQTQHTRKGLPVEFTAVKTHLEELQKASLTDAQSEVVKRLLELMDIAQQEQDSPTTAAASAFSQTYN